MATVAPPKFKLSYVSDQFTHQWSFFSSLIFPFTNLVVLNANPRRYAVGFFNNDNVQLHLCTLENAGVLGLTIAADSNYWLNVKDHAHLPQLAWIANGTSGTERLTVLEVNQVP